MIRDWRFVTSGSSRAVSRRRTRAARRGVALTETAFVMPVFLLIVLGMIDLTVMVVRRQALTQAARAGARAAIVRGAFAERLGPLGPAELTGHASDANAIAEAVRGQIYLMDPTQTRVTARWLDGGNDVNQRVCVTVTGSFSPLVTFIFGRPTWTLTDSSTMTIAH